MKSTVSTSISVPFGKVLGIYIGNSMRKLNTSLVHFQGNEFIRNSAGLITAMLSAAFVPQRANRWKRFEIYRMSFFGK